MSAPSHALDAAAGLLRKHVEGANVVDEWGMDRDVVSLGQRLARLRWDAVVGGAEHVPAAGGALLVANRRAFAATPLLVAAAVGRATGRPIRFAGVTDRAPVGPALRRLGGVLDRIDEVRGLLRAGELVAVWCAPRRTTSHRVGRVPAAVLGAAIGGGVPVLPVAVVAPPLARRVRLEVGPALSPPAVPGPLAAAELAEAVQAAVQRIVDEASPPLWLLPG